MKNTKTLCYVGLSIVTSLIVWACGSKPEEKSVQKQEKYLVSKAEAKLWIKATQLFKPLPELPEMNETQKAQVELGKKLYLDVRLSKNNTISCNSCHNLKNYGVDNESTSPGADRIRGGRNSPTSFNAYLHVAQFWDGRAATVEDQAKGPILNPVEMGMPNAGAVVAKLKSIPEYYTLFKAAFPTFNEPITYENLANAIGAFERTLQTPSRFDKFLANDFEALSAEEKEGLKNFIEVGCATCHLGVGLGGSMYRVFGEKHAYWPLTKSSKIDKGMYELTGSNADLYKFKVPSLRNVAKTHPYFHDGSVEKLEDAIRIMGKTQLDIDLPEDKVQTIKLFLESLTGDIPSTAKI